MEYLVPSFYFLLGFAGMEVVAWTAHKYLMHGPLWFIHRDHHQPGQGFWQRNDLFILVFATPSWLSIYWGLQAKNLEITLLGFGILAYGIAYAVVHEIMIHRRFTWLKAPKSEYWQRVVKQHKKHHQSPRKDRARYFGMLWPSSEL
jgi:beta-carotene 3-hydroxylase